LHQGRECAILLSLVETRNTKNAMLTYLTSFASEIQALEYADTLIYGGVVQKKDDGKYHVWQINFQSQQWL
jgi:hypothetical protein